MRVEKTNVALKCGSPDGVCIESSRLSGPPGLPYRNRIGMSRESEYSTTVRNGRQRKVSCDVVDGCVALNK